MDPSGIALTPVIQAAGGVLIKEGRTGPLVMLVRRRKYQDWALPKGKLDPGESWQEAALREVLEETGVTATLGDFLDAVGYVVKGVPKVVLFWRMTPNDESGQPHANEIDEAAWLSIDDALGRLSYERERRLLAGAFAQ
jgi:8-oxo-dGTP diphosphatase